MGAKPKHMDGGRAPSSVQRSPWLRSVMTPVLRAAKRVLLETTGWLMLLGALAAIPLPGPGLLITFAGLLMPSRQYDWAERRVEVVRLRALQAAAKNVATWTRLAASVVGAILIVPAGIAWIASPPAPLWWPLASSWWLPGGAGDRRDAVGLCGHRACPAGLQLPAVPRRPRGTHSPRKRHHRRRRVSPCGEFRRASHCCPSTRLLHDGRTS